MNNNKTIVFVNQSAGYLMVDTIHAHLEKYDKAVLLTGNLNPRNRQLDPSVKVHRLATYRRSSSFLRLLTWGLAFIKSWFLIRFKYPKAHLYLVSNPPMATLLPRWLPNAFSLLIYDVYPDALVTHNIFSRESNVVKWWQRQNKKVFARASQIFTISSGMQKLVTQYIDSSKVKVVPVWTDNDFLKPIPKEENTFIVEQELQDRFIILYSGNLGKTHELTVLVDLAERLRQTRAFVLIIGEGDQYRSLKERIEDSGLQNIRLLPWQPTEKLPFTMASADVGVVSLGTAASHLSVPSKFYNLLSIGGTILGIADQAAELARLIDYYQVGECFSPDEVKEMETFLIEVMDDSMRQERYGSNALKASRDFTPENAKMLVA